MNGLVLGKGGLYRIKEFDIDWVLRTFSEGLLNKKAYVPDLEVKIVVNNFTYLVKKGRLKYKLFLRDGLTCVQCGKTANKCFLEMTQDVTNVASFNFYRIVSGENELLFTVDHILPKSLGGKSALENYQIMCRDCNLNKASTRPQYRKSTYSFHRMNYRED